MVGSTAVQGLSNDELHSAVIESQRLADLAAARQAELLSEWDTRKLWASDGSRSCSSRLARETGLSKSDAAHLIDHARKLRHMPCVSFAFGSATLSSSRVDLLTRVNHGSVRADFIRDEEMLVGQVSQLSFKDAVRLLRYWSNCADTVGAEGRAAKQLDQRTAFLSRTFEGTLDLKALFDSVNGEIFSTEHERLERELFEADWAAAKKLHGQETRAEYLGRTPAQRRCDALVLMAKRSAARQTSCKTPRPLVSVVVDYRSFETVCELASGTVITPGQIVPLLSESDIERIVFDGGSRVIDVSRKRRFTGALRRAIEVRDRHCQDSSGCDEQSRYCDVDHAVAFVNNGTTEQSNGQLLCAKHNRIKGTGPP